uniref:ATP synthase F0 subunit 8 n=1 Tax=Phyxioschema suthepium TaxID=1155482 RepID=L7NVW5_9ARAC|nr:ATP synthase F0 subunit 8 [Phyxioschema suthepium]AFC77859.1 ATP synthase F0 subunit 8 [Phyxioschema suthepium]
MPQMSPIYWMYFPIFVMMMILMVWVMESVESKGVGMEGSELISVSGLKVEW